MNETQKYRSRMRKNALKVIGALYLLVISPFLFKFVCNSSLATDCKPVQARVTWSRRSSGKSDDHGKCGYSYRVDGRDYSGSADIELPAGSALNVYYSESIPANSSWQEPHQAKEKGQFDLVFLTFAYGFMAMLALVLMSVILPPPGAPVPEVRDIGISES